jgi:hypothetical protein
VYLLGSLVLWPILEQHLEEGEGCILVESLGEAVQGRGHLQALVQHPPLPLDAHVLGPPHKSVHVLLGWRAGSHSCEIARP